jgi:hypothetical protein
MKRKTFAILATLALASAGGLGAQVVPRQFQIGPRGGSISFDDASCIQSSGALGVDAAYFLNRTFGIGFVLDLARPVTEGSCFPAEFSFGDTVFVYRVQQPLTVLNAQIQGVASFTMGRLSPFVAFGVGSYQMYLDPQVDGAPSSFSDLAYSFGGGVTVRTSETSGIRFEIRDNVFTNFDREKLNPIDPRFRANRTDPFYTQPRFPRLVTVPTDPKETLHNWTFMVAFSFVPAAM